MDFLLPSPYHSQTPKVSYLRPNNLVFGCGNDDYGSSPKRQLGGILGLAATGMSVLFSFGSVTERKFSYCLGNASDPSTKSNLIIGRDAHLLSGLTTPFVLDKYYYVYVSGIQVGSQDLDLPHGSLAEVILDSGTVYTFVPPVVYDKLTNAISQAIKRFKVQPIPPTKKGLLCYNGNIGRDLNGFPTLTIKFEGYGGLVLETWSIFLQQPKKKERFCLAFAPNGANKPTIIGSMAQQFYNFRFDLEEEELSIVHSTCIY